MCNNTNILGFTIEGEIVHKCTDELSTSCLVKCLQCGKILDIKGGPKPVLCKECMEKSK
ncbi:hypothetical protein SAMN05660297_00101 [Natronincola peptidivorans]|uniref:Uncharacterized protein n=1 Tax=Natronincola peptidivorans TaxID=426128 RepID=A0A1H9Y8H3_9FIRM|nr:hypothetical protein [Natronincola peptidivorans]SES65227.1 hypothetical protein SAMN05660297_00101 [Natronincola peptidivorans]